MGQPSPWVFLVSQAQLERMLACSSETGILGGQLSLLAEPVLVLVPKAPPPGKSWVPGKQGKLAAPLSSTVKQDMGKQKKECWDPPAFCPFCDSTIN